MRLGTRHKKTHRFTAWLAAVFLITGSGVVLTDVDAALAGPCPTGWTFYAPNCQKTYTYTGSAQTFTVPAVGVTSVTIHAYGGSGGHTAAGGGGVASGALDVTPGQIFSVYVGGKGGEATAAGGWNGGGAGMNSNANGVRGNGQRDGVSDGLRGGGGGGASDVRLGGTALSNRIIVAGGGGGGVWDTTTNNYVVSYYVAAQGGSGGSVNYGASGAGAGGSGVGQVHASGGGGGTGGGSKGGTSGLETYCYPWDTRVSYSSAANGKLGDGGAGGSGAPENNTSTSVRWCAAGGGGGGYYGGGGAYKNAGGGGGSSFKEPTKFTTVSDAARVALGPIPNTNGNGSVTIAYRASTILSIVPDAATTVNGATTFASGSAKYEVTFADAVKVNTFTDADLSVSGPAAAGNTWNKTVLPLNSTDAGLTATKFSVELTRSGGSPVLPPDGKLTLTANANTTTRSNNEAGVGTLDGDVTIDHTGPIISTSANSFAVTPVRTKSSPLTVTARFNEGTSSVDASRIVIGGTSAQAPSTSVDDGTNTTETKVRWVVSGTPSVSGSTATLSVKLVQRVTVTLNSNSSVVSVTDTDVSVSQTHEGSVAITFLSGFVSDALGNLSAAVTTPAISTVDYTPPTLTSIALKTNTQAVGAPAGNYSKNSSTVFVVTFSEDVTGLVSSNGTNPTFKITDAAGTLKSNGTCIATPATNTTTNSQVEVTISGCGDGTFKLYALPGPLAPTASTIVDLAGNALVPAANSNAFAAVNSGSVIVDTVAPSITSGKDLGSSSARNSNSISFTIGFTNAAGNIVYGLTADDLVISGTSGTKGTWTKTLSGPTGGVYTFTVANTSALTGTLVVNLPAGAATDEAGNPTPAATQVTRELNFPTQITLGTVSDIVTDKEIILLPNAALADKGAPIYGFRIDIETGAQTGDKFIFVAGSSTGSITATGSGTNLIEFSTSTPASTTNAQWQAAFRAVKFTTTSASATQRKIRVILKPAELFNYDNRHVYQRWNESSDTNWGDARTRSRDRYLGTTVGFAMQGYLPEITSQAENSYVDAIAEDGKIWLGGQKSGYSWYWRDGPKNGQKYSEEYSYCSFWLFGCQSYANDPFKTSFSTNSFYNNWNTGFLDDQPDNSADTMSMRANGKWDDTDTPWINVSPVKRIIVEFGDQEIGDSKLDTLILTTALTGLDVTPPSLKLSSEASLAADGKMKFFLTAGEAIDCNTVTAADFTFTGLDSSTFTVTQNAATPGVCEISVEPTIGVGLSGSVGLAKSGSFSVSDLAGKAQTAIASGNPLSLTITVPQPTYDPSTAPSQVNQSTYLLTPPNTGFSPTDPSAANNANRTLLDNKVVAPPVSAPVERVTKDISTNPVTSRYEVSDSITVIAGTKVGANFKVQNGKASTHEAWAYFKVGLTGDWVLLGKQALASSAGAALAEISEMAFAKPGNYAFKILVVEAGTAMPSLVSNTVASASVSSASVMDTWSAPASIAVPLMRAARIGGAAPSGSSYTDVGSSVFAAAANDGLSGIGSDSYDLNITVTGTEPTVTPTNPRVTNVVATPNTGSFKVGDSISIAVTFDMAVDVIGAPALALNLGSNTGTAAYVSGSGTSTLTFAYTVQAGDNIDDLDYTGITALNLPVDTTIKKTGDATLDADLSLATPGTTGSISAASAIVVDTQAPSVTITSKSPGATSQSISFEVTADEAIDCSSLSTVIGEDFEVSQISAINSIVQTSSRVCTVNATSSIAKGATGTSSISTAFTFGVADIAGNEQTVPATTGLVSVAMAPALDPVTTGGGGSGGSGGSSGGGTGGGSSGGGTSGGGNSGGSGSGSGSGGSSGGSASGGSGSGTSGSGSDDSSSSGTGGDGTSDGTSGGSETSASGSGDTGSGTNDTTNLSGPAVIDPANPFGSAAELFNPLNVDVPNFMGGAPVADPAIGATGNDSYPPKPFDPMGSTESAKAAVQNTSQLVSAIAGVAAAAAAAGAVAAAAGAVAGASGAAGAAGAAGASGTAGASAAGSFVTTTLASSAGSSMVSSINPGSGNSGGTGNSVPASQFAAASTGRRVGSRSNTVANLASRISNISPLIAKIFSNASYLRSLFGNYSVAIPAVAAITAVLAAIQNGGELSTPQWIIFAVIAVLGVFDSFAGFIAAIAFAITTSIIAGVENLGDLRLLLGVLLVATAPIMIARAFRSRRKSVTRGAAGAYELLVDVAVIGFVVYWLTSIMIASMPALSGTTLSVANHVGDFAIVLAAAAIVRVLIEELALRLDANAFAELDEAETPSQAIAVKLAMLVIRYGLYLFVASALFGFSPLVALSCALFVAPVVIGWYSHRLPNSPVLWKVLPTKLPGLVLILFVSALTLVVSNQAFGTDPEAAVKTFALLPVPLLALSILGAFGRHGASPAEPRPVTLPKYRLVYRVGGVLILFVAMRLTGIL